MRNPTREQCIQFSRPKIKLRENLGSEPLLRNLRRFSVFVMGSHSILGRGSGKGGVQIEGDFRDMPEIQA